MAVYNKSVVTVVCPILTNFLTALLEYMTALRVYQCVVSILPSYNDTIYYYTITDMFQGCH